MNQEQKDFWIPLLMAFGIIGIAAIIGILSNTFLS
mgnify:CR=1 FL=1